MCVCVCVRERMRFRTVGTPVREKARVREIMCVCVHV